MRVVFLGTGTLEPQADRASTALAFVHEGEQLFVDFGRNALSRCIECGLDPMGASDLLLTHLHPDHCCELVSLLFARNYHRTTAEPADPGAPDTRAPLRITGPVGTRLLLERLQEAWSWLQPRYPLEVAEIGDGWSGTRCGFEVAAVSVPHGAAVALGYRVAREGATVAFTGDSGPGPVLDGLAGGVDLLIAECGQRAGTRSAAHLWPEDVADLARRAQCRTVALTHFYPESAREEALGVVSAGFDGEVYLAEDRQVLEIDAHGVRLLG